MADAPKIRLTHHSDYPFLLRWAERVNNRTRLEAIFLLAALAVLTVLIVSIIRTWPFTTDDAYIPLRYASHWANHGQLNWNLNDPERVEGYCSSLYMFLAFLAIKISIPPILFLKLLSVISLLGSFVLVYDLTCRLSNRWFGLVAAAFYAGYFGTIWWAVSALETLFYVLLILLSIKIYIISMHASFMMRRVYLAILSAVIFITGVTTPEGPVIGIALGSSIVILGFVRRDKAKSILLDLACLAAPFLLLYGVFFPGEVFLFSGNLAEPVLLQDGISGKSQQSNPYVPCRRCLPSHLRPSLIQE